ncbi:hypothetical protein RBS60_17895 [Sinomonas sp. ASV486]|uniref:Uncharacterized protein n=1 Tax=Sinomonas puerhi TaxID=3238584 RepID=A0AB39L0H4_9MICC|nr:hypothetical protein [Sinomonas sp. ASV486]MDQ4492077.1 hypothetical protein [Sinomonas sp. ASV486]
MHTSTTDRTTSTALGRVGGRRPLAPHPAEHTPATPRTSAPYVDERASIESLVRIGVSEQEARAHLARLAAGDVWGG